MRCLRIDNAGVSQPQRLMNSTQAGHDLVMNSSVRGAIVCVGSVAASSAARTARRSALLGGQECTLDAVAPGLADTDLLIGKIDDAGKRRVAEGVPLRRLAVPADIADACLFLASDQSAYSTGVVLHVSGDCISTGHACAVQADAGSADATVFSAAPSALHRSGGRRGVVGGQVEHLHAAGTA